MFWRRGSFSLFSVLSVSSGKRSGGTEGVFDSSASELVVLVRDGLYLGVEGAPERVRAGSKMPFGGAIETRLSHAKGWRLVSSLWRRDLCCWLCLLAM